MTTIITRFPPSPTGLMHVGTAKTALTNYLFAKKHGGKVILRWEDTDKARSRKEFEQEIFEGLDWLGLKFDEVYHQSERSLIYRKYIEKMIADGTAYLSEETKTSLADEFGENDEAAALDGAKRVVRFKNPNKVITYTDVIRGEISVDTTELGDFVIARSIEEPLYHLAVVIDDFEMKITHIIRGEDGIYNTPRQILIQEAIGAPRPVYCHFPFILGTDKSKLSKRNGSIPVSEYKKQGFLPEALLNYLALLGWNPGTSQEVFSLQELCEAFDLNQIQKGGGIFDHEKLLWFNREHMKRLSDADFKKYATSFLPAEFIKMPQWSDEQFNKLLPELRERIAVFSEVTTLAESGELNFAFIEPSYEAANLMPATKKGEEVTPAIIISHLQHIKATLEALDDTAFTKDNLKNLLWDYATEKGRSAVLWPMRYCLSGRDKSPDPFTLSQILGKSLTIERINKAISMLQA